MYVQTTEDAEAPSVTKPPASHREVRSKAYISATTGFRFLLAPGLRHPAGIEAKLLFQISLQGRPPDLIQPDPRP